MNLAVTDIYYVSEKNLPFQNCMYLQHIQDISCPQKPVISSEIIEYHKSSLGIDLEFYGEAGPVIYN
jgi:hypothetical protein